MTNPFIQPQDQTLKILIGTPAAQGQVSLAYFLSIMEVMQNINTLKHRIFIRNQLRVGKEQGALNEQQVLQLQELESQNLIDVQIGLYTLSNESLLSRGRNHIAAVAIRQGWDKLFFIDADAKFTFRQFWTIATAPMDFVAGLCPLKVLPISLNFLPFEEDEFYYKDAIRSIDSLYKMKEGHKSSWLSVPFVGTAFMCLSRKVLLHCAAASEEYQYPNPASQQLHTHWNMFDTRPMHGKYMSEDWSMCYRARELGCKVYVNADVIISHVGSFNYAPELAILRDIPKEQGVFSSQVSDHPKTEKEKEDERLSIASDAQPN